MAIVVDYSAGLPGAAHIAAATVGDQPVIGAKRYIGQPGHPKNTTAAELADFTAHNLGMSLVFEGGADNWRGGRAAGEVNARAARSHATKIGFPTDRPIDMAIDRDVVTAAEFDLVEQYLRGANGPLGAAELTGVYGEYDVMVRAFNTKVAYWFWQSRAWSGTPVKLFAGRHLFQRVQQIYVNNIQCDVNDVLRTDWGQHHGEGLDMPTADEIAKAVWDYALTVAVGDSKDVDSKLGPVWHSSGGNMLASVYGQTFNARGNYGPSIAPALKTLVERPGADVTALADKIVAGLLAHGVTGGASVDEVKTIVSDILLGALARAGAHP